VTVLPLHEIESVLCDREVVAALAAHLGRDAASVWTEFLNRVRKEFQGQTLNGVVARRVRSRIGDLLDGAFTGAQVVTDLSQTSANHSAALAALDLSAKAAAMFTQEQIRVTRALTEGTKDMIAILPGKHLLSLLPSLLGLRNTAELTGLIVRSLDRERLKQDDPLASLGIKVEGALLAYLPPRRV
jgi:hypothetical protein